MPDLFRAAGRNDVPAVKALLARGADPNCRNFLSFTPLMIAAAAGHQPAVEALLAGGADLNAVSPYGTALTFAAMTDQRAVAKFLLAKGIRPDAGRGDGITILMLAAGNGDAGLAKTALDRGADPNAKNADGATALIYAARFGQTGTARLLLERKANVNAADSRGWTALTFAAANGHAAMAQLLLGKGADPNARDNQGRTPLIAGASYSGDEATLRALLAKGADPRAKDRAGRTAADFLARRGHAPLLSLLKGAPVPVKAEIPDARTAVERGLALVQFSTATIQKRANCASCHHQGLGLMATATARDRGFAIDGPLAEEQIRHGLREFEAALPMLQKILDAPEMAKMIPSAEFGDLTPVLGFILAGVAAHGKPATPTLSAAAVILGREQFPDGSWRFGLTRTPMQSSYFAMTALAIRALQAYAPPGPDGKPSAETADRIRRATAWLLATPARTSEDRAYRLLALKWAGAAAEERKPAVAEILADQRPDGGWAQLPSLRSDAYATGQALYALAEGGDVPVSDGAADSPYGRGVRFLLRTQDDDGSWYVHKRAIPANNYLDAGFPHGESQYSSYAGTVWATMALALVAEGAPSRPRPQARR